MRQVYVVYIIRQRYEMYAMRYMYVMRLQYAHLAEGSFSIQDESGGGGRRRIYSYSVIL